MSTYLSVGQLLVAIALIVVVLLQLHGGGIGGIFGQSDTVYRTRRGFERSLFILTIVLAVIFVVVAMILVLLSS
jgi:preprotein translocase subunit SecG